MIEENTISELDYIHQVTEIVIYYGCYLSIIIFTVIYWKNSIYKAACGGNGILQQTEMVKLAAAYAFCGYCVEIIYDHDEFDYGFATFILVTLGITMTKGTLPVFNKKSKDIKDG